MRNNHRQRIKSEGLLGRAKGQDSASPPQAFVRRCLDIPSDGEAYEGQVHWQFAILIEDTNLPIESSE
jgi:hypothetical protein